ncbi:MAG TPA: hypothetical protein EYN66_01405, partial [Myxococcales bacterium]|nr:hypothetical protein [Myxococcales bacterium]
MSKITRKKLTRGVALGTDHVHDPLDAIGVADADQVKVQWAPFRVTFNFPVLNDANRPISIPFTLPPLQQFFDPVDKEAVKGTPAIILDEIAFSFDSRSERGAIREVLGSKDHATTKRCDVEIAIMEKGSDGLHFNKEVSSLHIPSVSIAGSKTERANPIAVDNINAAIDPYKSYLLKLLAPGLYDSTDPDPAKLAMPNATVSLRFRHPMVVGVTTAQNPPALLKGAAATIGITTPPASTVIEASHLQVEMGKVDEVFLSKLNGGFPVDPTYHIDADSGY